MPWNGKTPHQPKPWAHGDKSKGPKSLRNHKSAPKGTPLVNKEPPETAA